MAVTTILFSRGLQGAVSPIDPNTLFGNTACAWFGIALQFDYFARDCRHLGIGIGFDVLRLMKFARALPVDDAAASPTPAQTDSAGEKDHRERQM